MLRIAADLPDMSAIWPQVYERPRKPRRTSTKTSTAVSSATATGAAWNRCAACRRPNSRKDRTGFDDERLEEILFRYRARNFPHTLA
jgi:exodeoxyribonuclease-1